MCGKIVIIVYLFTATGLSPGDSGSFTCIQNMKLVTNKFKWGGLHEKHVVATWNIGNHLSSLSVCLSYRISNYSALGRFKGQLL